jgi:hypothetical protein
MASVKVTYEIEFEAKDANIANIRLVGLAGDIAISLEHGHGPHPTGVVKGSVRVTEKSRKIT